MIKKNQNIFKSPILTIILFVLFWIFSTSYIIDKTQWTAWSGWKKTQCYDGILYRTRIAQQNVNDCELQIMFKSYYKKKIEFHFTVSEYYKRKLQKCNRSLNLERKEFADGGVWTLENCFHENKCLFKVWVCDELTTFENRKGEKQPFQCDRRRKKNDSY